MMMMRNSAAGARSGGGGVSADAEEAQRAPWRMVIRGLRIAKERMHTKCGIAAVLNVMQGFVPRDLLQSWARDTDMLPIDTLAARLRQVLGDKHDIVPVPPEGVNWQLPGSFTVGDRFVAGFVYVENPYAQTGDSHFKCLAFYQGPEGVLAAVRMDSSKDAQANGVAVSVLAEGSTALAAVKQRFYEAALRVRATPSTDEALRFHAGPVALILSGPGEVIQECEKYDLNEFEGVERWLPTPGLTYSDPFDVVLSRADDGTYVKRLKNFSIGGR